MPRPGSAFDCYSIIQMEKFSDGNQQQYLHPPPFHFYLQQLSEVLNVIHIRNTDIVLIRLFSSLFYSEYGINTCNSIC